MLYIYYTYAAKIIYRFPIFIPFEMFIIIWRYLGTIFKHIHAAAEEQHHNFLRLDQPISSRRFEIRIQWSRCQKQQIFSGNAWKITEVTVTEHNWTLFKKHVETFRFFQCQEEMSYFLCIQLVLTPDPLGIRTELPVPAMQSKSSPQRHFCQRHEVARSFFQARRQKTFHSHPFPSQNANANENGRRIYDDSICFNLRRESGDSFLIALLLWIGLSSTVLFHGDFLPRRTCLHGMVRQQSPKLRAAALAEVRSIKIIET